jgi:hypothetical protein
MRQSHHVAPGERFGRLVVVAHERSPRGVFRWRCVCDCGETRHYGAYHLCVGGVVSCGCYRSQDGRNKGVNTTHGHAIRCTRTYKAWASMKARCKSQTHPSWSCYGGRGISVCERWVRFEAFLADMGEVPAGRSLDRINVNGNYEPGNCRWATMSVQGNNRRSCKFVSAFGESKTVANWTRDRRCSVRPDVLGRRLLTGWNVEDAITRPSEQANRKTA